METVRDYLHDNGFTLNALLDKTGETSIDYHVRQHPMKVLIDTNGKIIATAVGYRKWDSVPMKALINKLIVDAQKEDKSAS